MWDDYAAELGLAHRDLALIHEVLMHHKPSQFGWNTDMPDSPNFDACKDAINSYTAITEVHSIVTTLDIS